MAKHNLVQLYAKVDGSPRILKDDGTGAYVRGMCYVEAVHGVRDNGTDIQGLKYDRLLLMTGVPEQIRKMETLLPNDIVEIKGALTTRNVTKVCTCALCGGKIKQPGEITFVTPIFIGRAYTGLDENAAYEAVRLNGEISNNAYLIGYLCSDVDYYSNGKMKMASYQIAVKRKFYLSDDNPLTSTDYPHIIAFGDRAKSDSLCIHKGSMVLVDGILQSRSFQRKGICENCGQETQWDEETVEVVAYSTEYLQNYTAQEELKKKEEEARDTAEEQVFGKK